MHCPVCKAANDRGPQCRRCRADLSLLFTLEEDRDRLLRMAAGHAAAGRWSEPASLGGQAQELRRGEDSKRLLALAALLQRDFPAAWGSYTRMRSESQVAR